MVEASQGVRWNTATTGYGQQVLRRFYTVQRVNGTGPTGKEEGGGGHKHNLEQSDLIKKNSVVRWMMKNKKEVKRKVPVSKISCVSFLRTLRCWLDMEIIDSGAIFRHESRTHGLLI